MSGTEVHDSTPRENHAGLQYENRLRDAFTEAGAEVVRPSHEGDRILLDEVFKTDILLRSIPNIPAPYLAGLPRGPIAIQLTLDLRHGRKPALFMTGGRAVSDRLVYLSIEDQMVVQPNRALADLILLFIQTWFFDAERRHWGAIWIHVDRHYRVHVYDLKKRIAELFGPIEDSVGQELRGKVTKVVTDRPVGKQPFAHITCALRPDKYRHPFVFFLYFDACDEATRARLLRNETGFEVTFTNIGFTEDREWSFPKAHNVRLYTNGVAKPVEEVPANVTAAA